MLNDKYNKENNSVCLSRCRFADNKLFLVEDDGSLSLELDIEDEDLSYLCLTVDEEVFISSIYWHKPIGYYVVNESDTPSIFSLKELYLINRV